MAAERRFLPTITERNSWGQVESDPYSRMLAERIVFLGAPVDEVSSLDVMAQLLYLDYEASDRDIRLYLNSPGGSLTATMAIYDTMRHISADISTVCLGQAGAAATVLLAAGTPGKRAVLPYARVIVHEPAIEGVTGPAADMRIQAEELLRGRATMARVLAEHTGQSVQRISADLSRETILEAKEAVNYGIVDELIPYRKKRSS
jgi:ATP-dependent Clp protease protease subunit